MKRTRADDWMEKIGYSLASDLAFKAEYAHEEDRWSKVINGAQEIARIAFEAGRRSIQSDIDRKRARKIPPGR